MASLSRKWTGRRWVHRKKKEGRLFLIRLGICSLWRWLAILSLLVSPSGSVVKSPSANAGDMGSIPGPGRFHMSLAPQSTEPAFCSLSFATKKATAAKKPPLAATRERPCRSENPVQPEISKHTKLFYKRSTLLGLTQGKLSLEALIPRKVSHWFFSFAVLQGHDVHSTKPGQG